MKDMPFFIATLIASIVVFIAPPHAHAYLPFSAAETAYIEAEDPASVRPGMIVARDEKSFRLTNKDHDIRILGVIVEDSDVVVQISDELDRKQHIIATSGELLVLVNTSAGDIKKGDYITSSATPGIGMRANSGGFVLGTALEDYANDDTEAIGSILVLVNVRSLPTVGPIDQFVRTTNNLIKFGPQGLSRTSPFVRYVLALGIVGIFVFGGFYMFGRIALRGIEALGRNPLARTTIMTGIIINSILTVTLVVIGVIVAYIVITV